MTTTINQPMPAQTQQQAPIIAFILKLLPAIIPLFIFLHTGFIGIDFGLHWDEPNKLESVSQSLERGILVPTYYQKPGMIFWVTLASITPDIPAIIQSDPKSYLIAIKEHIDQPAYMLQARGGHLIVASLGILWVYGLVWFWRKRWYEGLIAACVLAFSWEAAYHARFVATDSTVMSFSALTLLLVIIAYFNPKRRFWLWWAAIAGGFTLSSKYNAGLIILPVWLVTYFNWDQENESWFDLAARLFSVSAIFAAAYLFITPGTILAPERFISDVNHELRHYSVEGHGRYTVTPGLDHFGRNLYYLAAVALSPYPAIALTLFMLALFGMGLSLRQQLRPTLLLLIFPLVYLLYMSTQQVMFVRNMQPLFPVIAIFTAYGLSELIRLLTAHFKRYARWILVIGWSMPGIIIGLNVAWLYDAAESITQHGTDTYLNEMIAYIEDQPQTLFAASDQVWGALEQHNIAAPENLVHNGWDESSAGLIYLEEYNHRLPANLPFLVRWFGARQVNLNYYSSWKLNEHILLLTRDTLEQYAILQGE